MIVVGTDLGHYDCGCDRPKTLGLFVGKTWNTMILGGMDLEHYDFR